MSDTFYLFNWCPSALILTQTKPQTPGKATNSVYTTKKITLSKFYYAHLKVSLIDKDR